MGILWNDETFRYIGCLLVTVHINNINKMHRTFTIIVLILAESPGFARVQFFFVVNFTLFIRYGYIGVSRQSSVYQTL